MKPAGNSPILVLEHFLDAHEYAVELERTPDGYWFIDVLPPDESPATARRVAVGAPGLEQAVTLAIQHAQAGDWEYPF